MTGINGLFDCLDSIYPISTGCRNYLGQVVKSADYAKGSFLLREGRVSNRVWWLREGLVRFFYTHNQQEVSHYFVAENNIVLAIRSIYDQRPSVQAIMALEPAVTFYIEYSELLYLYEYFPEAHVIGRKIAEQYYTLLEKRLHAMALQKAVDRYRYLETHFAELLQRVPLKYLASFLDLEVHTISRMRRKNK